MNLRDPNVCTHNRYMAADTSSEIHQCEESEICQLKNVVYVVHTCKIENHVYVEVEVKKKIQEARELKRICANYQFIIMINKSSDIK